LTGGSARGIPWGVSLPLTALFIDCDSFFASVEQHLDPALRGRPVGVAPVMAETSCCIAASYEAKRHGVKTGTGIREARILCPGIAIVQAKPAEYVKVHHRIIAAVEDCIHVEAVLSIDEMWGWLPLNWRDPEFVRGLGHRIKESVQREIGESVKVSVGAAPNRYLAKMASKMGKPDGLAIIESRQLPEILHGLELRDFTGIAKNMEARLHAAGIHTVEALCAAPKPVLRGVWGGIMGDRLWHLLRGEVIPDLESSRRSIGHSHVLPPERRSPAKAWPVLCKLLHKACERLRAHGMLTGSLTVQLSFRREGGWQPELRFPETDSTFFLIRMMQRLWSDRPEPHAELIQVGVVLTRLVDRRNHTPDLFQGMVAEAMAAEDLKRQRLDVAIDKLRARYGRQAVFFGSVQDSRDAAPMRISFTHIPDLELEQDESA
jgi:DNA polymerase IV